MTCAHLWVANDGRDGHPRFEPQPHSDPLMDARCERCDAEQSFTQAEWRELLPTVVPDPRLSEAARETLSEEN
jgi:hypothetical protein